MSNFESNRGDRAAFIAFCKAGTPATFSAWWCQIPTLRRITELKTNRVGFSHPLKNETSWLDFPKADDIIQPVHGVFVIFSFGTRDVKHALVYDFNGTPTDFNFAALCRQPYGE